MLVDTILEERGNNYGSFNSNANISQDLKNTIFWADNYNKLSSIHKEALHNIFQKIARIVNGNPDYEDNWIDIIGYAQLALNEIKNSKTAVGTLKV